MKIRAHSCPLIAQRDGERLRRVLQEPAVDRLAPGDGWGYGGCWLLAEALVSTVFPGAKIKGVWETQQREGRAKKILHHAVVEIAPGCYLDHNGAQSKAELLRNQQEDIAAPYLGPWQPQRAARSGIECPVDSLRALRQRLKAEFASD